MVHACFLYTAVLAKRIDRMTNNDVGSVALKICANYEIQTL